MTSNGVALIELTENDPLAKMWRLHFFLTLLTFAPVITANDADGVTAAHDSYEYQEYEPEKFGESYYEYDEDEEDTKEEGENDAENVTSNHTEDYYR